MKLVYCVRLSAYLCKYRKKCRSVDKFGRLVPGSDLVKFPIDRLVIASPPRPLVEFSEFLVRMFPSMSSCASTKKIRSVEKHGCRRPSLIFLVIASPQKLRIIDVKNSCESFTELKDSHVFVTSVKIRTNSSQV